jgi:DNA-binding LacI/PurR family transcriptional regulator
VVEGATGRITIRDIAREAGVSVQTVSRVLNDRPDVAAGTRAKVEELIATMGYEPNVVAQALVSQRSTTFGYICSGLEYVGVSATLGGLAGRCESAGYALLLQTVAEGDYEAIASAMRFLIRRNVEGIVVQVPSFNHDDFERSGQAPAQLPRMVFLRATNTGPYPSIRVDDFGGGVTAVSHLVGRGRSRIAHITGPIDRHWGEAEERLGGWRHGMEQAGLKTDLIEAGDWTPASGAAAMNRLLERAPDLDAVFVSNDQMALGAMSSCRDAGRRIPTDVAIVGFDGLPESEHFEPPLTTVRQPMVGLGEQAIDMLLAAPESAEAAPRVLDIELIERASTD